MNLIQHQFKTDLRHFRSQILLLWIAFAAGPMVLIVSFSPESFSFVSALAMLWQIIGGSFLAVAVVQADSLVGTSAPWLTRPIRRHHLFWAKTLFLITVIFLPRLAFQSIGWLCRGYSAHLLLCGLGESMLYTFTVMFSVAVLAALTRSLARCFIALGIMTGGIFLWVAVVSVLVKIRILESSATNWIDTESLRASKTIAAFVVLAICALLGWIGQAYLRRWRFAVVMFAAGLFALPLITTQWRANFLKAKLAGTPPLTVQIIRTNSPIEGQMIYAEMAIKGVPKNQVAVGQEMWTTFRVNGHTTYPSRFLHPSGFPGRVRPARSPQELNYVKEIKAFFPTDTLWFENANFGGFISAFSDQELMNFYRQAPPGELRGDVTLDLYEVRKVAEVPLNPTFIKTIPGQHVAIRKVSLTGNEIVAILEESSVNLSLDRSPVTSVGGRFGNSDARNNYVLYQPDSGEAYLGGQVTVNYVATDVMSGEMHTSLRLTFHYSALRERLAGITAAEWLQKARLCVFTPFYKGTASLAFNEENYQWQPAAYSQQHIANTSGITAIESAALPEFPTAQQLEAYLDTILFNSPDAWREDERQKIQSKLSAIGTNGLTALLGRLPLSERKENYFVLPVICQLATRDHLPDLLTALERDSRLTEIIVQKHWEPEALPVLLRMLSDHRRALPADALRIVAEAKNPATYRDLRWHFVRLDSNFYRAIPALESCPGFDVSGTITEAWNRLNPERVGDPDIAVAAAKLGLPDALPTAVLQLEKVGNREWLKRTLPQLAEMTGYSGPATNVVAWLGTNLDKLRFDPNLRRYVLE